MYISNKMEHFSYKGECGIRVSRHLKEELVWAIEKWWWLISICSRYRPLPTSLLRVLDALEYEFPGRAVTLGPVADVEQGLGLLLRELLLADSHERVDDDVRDSRVGLVLDGAAAERLGEIFDLADGCDELHLLLWRLRTSARVEKFVGG